MALLHLTVMMRARLDYEDYSEMCGSTSTQERWDGLGTRLGSMAERMSCNLMPVNLWPLPRKRSGSEQPYSVREWAVQPHLATGEVTEQHRRVTYEKAQTGNRPRTADGTVSRRNDGRPARLV